jgi:hypothetical protein
MAFKMNGSPAKMGTISGTAGHSSALKMKAEADAASALKQKYTYKDEKGERVAVPKEGLDATGVPSGQFKGLADDKATDATWKKGQDKAKSEGGDLDALVKSRKGLKKGTPEYNKVQNQINSALGNKKRHGEGSTTTSTNTTTKNKPKNKIEKVVQKGEDKKVKIADKATKLTGEVAENVSKKTAKITKRGTKKEFGKGSKEHLAAKQAHLVAKEADRQGGEGGRKQGLFRKLSSKINKKRQAKNQAKIDAANSPADMNKKY